MPDERLDGLKQAYSSNDRGADIERGRSHKTEMDTADSLSEGVSHRDMRVCLNPKLR